MARATTTARKTTTKKAAPKAPTKATVKRAAPAAAAPAGVTADDTVIAANAAPDVVTEAAPETASEAAVEPTVQGPELKKKELIETAAQRRGIKKGDAKAAIEAALAIMGEAISKGEDLNLEPLGKLRIQREKDVPGGTVHTCRIRRKTPT